MPTDLYFASSNPFKIQELREIGAPHGYDVKAITVNKICEMQTDDLTSLVHDKTLQAFRAARLPVLVDHGGLYLDCLNEMPGGLTQLFWDKLKGKIICDIARALGNKGASAVATIGYCNGKRIYTYSGKVKGTIADAPRGVRDFQWDLIFIPDGHTKTYAEMTIPDKNAISQRRIAFEQLLSDLSSGKV